jgi:hypothetical protein
LIFGIVSIARSQEPPKPGPEHERFKQFEGTWEATPKFGGQDAKGTMTWKIGLGRLWLLSDFEGEMAGQKFQGKGMDTYDPAKKRVIVVWADSGSTSPLVSEGNFEKDGRVLITTGDGPGPDGKPTKYKTTTEFKDKDTIVSTLSTLDKDGKEQVIVEINYRRKK